MDFTIFYKSILKSKKDWDNLKEFDLFISAFDFSDRVMANFGQIRAKEKHWLITPHIKIADVLPPSGKIFKYDLINEDDFIVQYFEEVKVDSKTNLCVDITSLPRPFIIFLFRYLTTLGVKKVEVVYAEPDKYIKSEETEFSGFVDIVKTVPGCAASDLLPNKEDDVLILAVGYDDKLISAVAEAKRHCTIKYKMFGFPSLQADMYQESILQVHNARESLGTETLTIFAPAFDPFVTAQILKETIDGYLLKQQANFYLSPLSTKPQVLGFILYYLYEGVDKPVNIIFPYSNTYAVNTSSGVNKSWHYIVELP